MTGRSRQAGLRTSRPRGVTSRNPQANSRGPKAGGALVCADCGVVQHGGKWSWGRPPLAPLRSGRCPACQRVQERHPAGTLRLPPRLLPHKKEILRLARNIEKAEKAEHPLERLMDFEESDGHLVITTTGVHLARQVAHSLSKRFHAKPRYRYADNEKLVHVDWAPLAPRARRTGAAR